MMSIINAFDDSNEIVKASIFTKDMSRLPETAIMCFRMELIDAIKEDDRFYVYSETLANGEKIPLFKMHGKDIIVYRTLIGGPATASIMEELIARGVKKFIVFGSCGLLSNSLPKEALIIPVKAYRDEGTSYHYLPASEYVDIETADELNRVFDDIEINCFKTNTWTTDAIYRETVNKAELMRNNGCDVVEMECASIMAVCKLREVKAYQFLYSDDLLASDEWDMRTFKDDQTPLLKKCLEIATTVAEEI